MGIDRPRELPWQELVLGGTAVAVLLGLHLLPDSGGVDPVYELLSEYPLRSVVVGVPYTLALLSANTAVVLLGVAMVRQGLLRGWLTTTLLAVWCLSLLGLTVFLKDPVGSAGTWYGTAHKLCTVANFVSLPALCALLWRRFRTVSGWRGNARRVGVLAALSMVCAVPFAAAFLRYGGQLRATGTVLGLIERCIVVLDIATIVTLAAWSRAMAAARDKRRFDHEVI
ncbi:DUF998 domain-containing protein [Saccharothrix sp. ALI-22-I]|uniref:DUF998 domain-containing protein n=1 Tax=Saccharothrix sp. ALI-22-I TaxID=1933778 RepID=UPI0015C385A2|nr:DUF998 domain-containing protein [Saccharothrix sp. ALI-22-I]